jgi:hypothetical protein
MEIRLKNQKAKRAKGSYPKVTFAGNSLLFLPLHLLIC